MSTYDFSKAWEYLDEIYSRPDYDPEKEKGQKKKKEKDLPLIPPLKTESKSRRRTSRKPVDIAFRAMAGQSYKDREQTALDDFAQGAFNAMLLGLPEKYGDYEPTSKIAYKAGELIGMAAPIGGAYATGGRLAAKLGSKLLPSAGKVAQNLIRGGGAGLTYGTAESIVQQKELPEATKDIALETALFGAGDAAVSAIAPYVKKGIRAITSRFRKETPKQELLALPELKTEQLPESDIKLIPEITPEITPEGAIRRPGRVREQPLLPMTEGEKRAREEISKVLNIPRLVGEVDTTIRQKGRAEPLKLTPIEEETTLRRYAERLGKKWPLSPQDKAEVEFVKVIDEITPSVIERTVPPLESRRELINFVHEGLGGTISKSEIRRLPDDELIDLAEQVAKENKERGWWELAKEEASKRGIDLEDLYRTANEPDYAEWKNIVGLGEEVFQQKAIPSIEPVSKTELDNARAILRRTKNIDRAAKILETYPELKSEFKGWVTRIKNRKQPAKPSLTPEPPQPKPDFELKNARNILEATQNPQRMEKILLVYPELRKKFDKKLKRLQKPTRKAQKPTTPKQEQPNIRLGPAIWRNKDVELPIEVTGYLGKGSDGRHYVSIKGNRAIPLDEVIYPGQPRKAETYDAGTIGAAKKTIPEKGSTIPGTKQKVRSFHVTSQESPFLADEIKSSLLMDIYEGGPGAYTPVKLKEIDEQAKRIVDEDLEKATQFVLQDKEPSALHTAVGIRLIKKYQDKGNYERAIDVASALSEKLTKHGQAISAARIMSNLSPEGILTFAQRMIKKYNESRRFPKWTKEAVLTPETAKNLKELAERLQNAKTLEEKIEVSQELQAALNALKPPTLGRKIATAQTIAQLLNPKTQIRNILGNELFYRLERINKLVATPIDIARSKITGKPRTVTFAKGGQKSWENYFKGLKEGFKAGWKGVSPRGLESRYDLGQSLAFNKEGSPAERFMSFLERALWAVMRGFDYAAYNRAYWDTVGEIATLRAINETGKADKETIKRFMEEIAENIHDIADQYGKYVTYQDENLISSNLSRLKKTLNKITTGSEEIGLGEFILKYPKTPGALIARGLEYSPAGFLRSAYLLAKPIIKGGKTDPREVLLALSRAITGTTGLTGLGYFLADKGILTGEASKDKDVRALERQTGFGPFKVNLTALVRWVRSGFDPEAAEPREGDKIISFDWMQPIASSIAMGANMEQTLKELEESESNFNKITKSIVAAGKGGFKTIAEQPVLQGLQQLVKGYESEDIFANVINIGKTVPASFTPTLLNQIRQYSDNTKRISYDPNYFQEAINRAKYKIPGVNKSLPVEYTPLGEPAKTYPESWFSEKGNTFWNVFLNPAFLSKYKLTPEAKMVIDIYKETGETQHVPRVVNKYFKVGGKRIDLTPEEYSKLQRIVGEETKKQFARIPRNAPTELKIRLMKKALDEAGKKGKREILRGRGIKVR